MRNAQPHGLVFSNGVGKPDGHFLRRLKAIARKAGVENAELHRFTESALSRHRGRLSKDNSFLVTKTRESNVTCPFCSESNEVLRPIDTEFTRSKRVNSSFG